MAEEIEKTTGSQTAAEKLSVPAPDACEQDRTLLYQAPEKTRLYPAPPEAEDAAAGNVTEDIPAARQEETSAAQQIPEAEESESLPPAGLSNEAVTDYTAGMWKYLPVPENEPEPAPEYRNSFLKLPGCVVTAARVRGKKHKHEGSNCDDWYAVGNCGEITFLAVSDGAGSKKYSRIGARESCETAVRFLEEAFEELLNRSPELYENISRDLADPAFKKSAGEMAALVQQAVREAFRAVEAAYGSRCSDPDFSEALGRQPELKDFSGTLLLAIVVPVHPETKEHLVISCQIGDGMVFVMNSKGSFSNSLRLLGVPDSGAFSGETDFLTSPQMRTAETLQRRTRAYRGIVDTVMLMSDGVADDYFPNETEMRRLYFDLVLNGVIESGRPEKNLSDAQDRRLYKKIPEPLEYPWVNDRSVRVKIQYTRRVQEMTGATLEDLWDDPRLLDLAMIDLDGDKLPENPAERLQIWLDNYVERGSFDDRSLVIARM